jgi:hypothetical protein
MSNEKGIFTKEMVKAVDTVIKMNHFKSPKDKLCLILLMQDLQLLQQQRPKLICFRKVIDTKPKLEIVMSENQREFEGIIDGDKGQWKMVDAPEQVESKLFPLLTNTAIQKPKKTRGERLQQLYSPTLKAWNRYTESWTNGKSIGVLEKFGTAIVDGLPFTLLHKCFNKLGSWIDKSTKM